MRKPPADREPDPSMLPAQRVALVDLLDRVLAGGVVISGDITLALADVDLVQVSLRALITSVRAALPEVPIGEDRTSRGAGDHDEFRRAP